MNNEDNYMEEGDDGEILEEEILDEVEVDPSDAVEDDLIDGMHSKTQQL